MLLQKAQGGALLVQHTVKSCGSSYNYYFSLISGLPIYQPGVYFFLNVDTISFHILVASFPIIPFTVMTISKYVNCHNHFTYQMLHYT